MRETAVNERVSGGACREIGEIEKIYKISNHGLTDKQADQNRFRYGSNRPAHHRDTVGRRLLRAFVNPFSMVLLVLAVISMVTDRLLKESASENEFSVFIIFFMLIISGVVRFAEEMRAKKVADGLSTLLNTQTTVLRNGEWLGIPSYQLTVGDKVRLSEGDRVPADIRLTSVHDCYISESVITGESDLKEKQCGKLAAVPDRLSFYTNTVFSGSTVWSGTCEGIVLAVGKETVYGEISEEKQKNSFDRGSNSIAWVLIQFMLLLVPVVFAANGMTHGDWVSAFLFALSVAVGLTPELLPMVITACLAKGSYAMGKKQTIVKNINAMQAFGSMDVLCVDKTGTLTGDRLQLEYYMDVLGNESSVVLDAAYLNSRKHAGIQNHLDRAILAADTLPGKETHFQKLAQTHEKIDEKPFDSERRISEVLIKCGKRRALIVKGSVEAVTSRCGSVMFRGQRYPIENQEDVHSVVDEMLTDGMKVLAVAVKMTDRDQIGDCDERGLTLLGFLAFFDAPKPGTAQAIRKLKNQNVHVKILTGDNADVAISICRRLGMDTSSVMIGADFERLNDNDAQISVEKADIFAEVSPKQKAQIVSLLKSNGHNVGFLGDGMNDLPAVMEADVGISVDTAVKTVKDTADVILLKKDLGVLEEGILEGRRAFANMSKYVKITASSNLGNILAIVAASVLLPFFPMTSVQILLLNLLYDVLCLALPWDSVDEELLREPLDWSGRKLKRFMLFFGPLSSVFDLVTFGFLYFYMCPMICGGAFGTLSAAGQTNFIAAFQTGWFLESMWTQVLILHLLRTGRLPFLQSRPADFVLTVTLMGTGAFTLLVMTPPGTLFGMTILPPIYFVFLAITVVCYLLLITYAKKRYIRRYGRLI